MIEMVTEYALSCKILQRQKVSQPEFLVKAQVCSERELGVDSGLCSCRYFSFRNSAVCKSNLG